MSINNNCHRYLMITLSYLSCSHMLVSVSYATVTVGQCSTWQGWAGPRLFWRLLRLIMTRTETSEFVDNIEDRVSIGRKLNWGAGVLVTQVKLESVGADLSLRLTCDGLSHEHVTGWRIRRVHFRSTCHVTCHQTKEPAIISVNSTEPAKIIKLDFLRMKINYLAWKINFSQKLSTHVTKTLVLSAR